MITLRALYQRDKGICHICGNRIQNIEDATRDHVIPKALGGTAGRKSENIKLAHVACNSAKGKKLFRVEQHKTGWVVVDPNGGISEVYSNWIDAKVIVDDLNNDRAYLDKGYV